MFSNFQDTSVIRDMVYLVVLTPKLIIEVVDDHLRGFNTERLNTLPLDLRSEEIFESKGVFHEKTGGLKLWCNLQCFRRVFLTFFIVSFLTYYKQF